MTKMSIFTVMLVTVHGYILMQLQSFPNLYGECECRSAECLDVFGLCSVPRIADLFVGAQPTVPGPTLVPHPNLTIYTFNGEHIDNYWLNVGDNAKQTFLSTTDDFTVSFWVRVEATSSSAYLFSFELAASRYFSMFDRSNIRLNVYYFRDALDGFTASSDDGYNSQVAFSFYFDTSSFPSGLRDGRWHFLALTVSFPSMILTIDGIEHRPTMGNYYDNIEQRVLLDRLTDGSYYNMPAPVVTKSASLISSIAGMIGGSGRGNRYYLHGEMRQLVLSPAINDSSYVCLASCNNIIGLAPGRGANFSQFQTSYNPVMRTFQFDASTDAAGYTSFLQSLVYFTNGLLSPQESGESLRINLNINDEEGVGNQAEINLIGRSNQNAPVLVASGISVTDINYQVDFREDVDEQVPILAPQAFINDPDVESVVHNVTVTLQNKASGSLESLYLLDNPPALLNVTDADGFSLMAGDSADVIIIRSLDTTRVTDNRFITALVFLRYRNLANEPFDVDRTIEFTISDGRFFNNPRTITTINILAVNDVPMLDLNGDRQGGLDAVVEYDESGPPLNVVPNLIVLDSDSFILTRADARIEQIFDESNETIAVDASLVASHGLTCIPASCNGTALSIEGRASQPIYQSILRSLQYVNEKDVADLPNLRDRRVFVTVNDGTNSSNPLQNVLIDVVVAVTRVLIQLDAPSSKDYQTSFRESQANPVRCSGTVRVLDTSLDTLETVVVSIRTNVLPVGVVEVNESISLSLTDGLDVSIEINTALKRITFSQVAPISQYVEAISRIFYFNGETEPVVVTRLVDFLIIPGGGAPSDTSTCYVNVIGVNDHIPQCPAVEPISVLEEAPIGSEIVQLTATDLDQGVDGMITYQMIGGDNSLFETTPTGSVRLRGELDYESLRKHTVNVEACDGGTTPFCCQFNLTINVRDSNDNPPVFSAASYSYEVTENVVTTLAPPTIRTTDADEGVNAQLSMVEIDPNSFNSLAGCFDRFSVSLGANNSITLSIVPPGLDYEAAPSCMFRVVAYDAGIPRLNSSATVIVTVRDIDDFPPEFSLDTYTFLVNEDNNFVMVIGAVEATDRDSPSVTYSQSSLENLFQVNLTTGSVSILFESNFDVARQYTFTAIATDPAGNTDNATVIVNIEPINNSPPNISLNGSASNAERPFLYVEEGPPISLLLDPSVTDPDPVPLIITRIVVSVLNSGNPSSEVLAVADQSIPHRVLRSSSGELIIEPLRMTNISDIVGLLSSITYSNNEDELSECDSTSVSCMFGLLSRTLAFSVNDGIFSSNRALAYVQFELINDPPSVDLDSATVDSGFSTSFTEQSGSIPIVNLNNYFIMDEDNVNLTSLTCTISNPLDNDEELFITGTLPSGIALTSSSSTTLQLEGSASITSYERVLEMIRYISRSVNPNTSDRFIHVVVSDGILTSSTAIATISYVVRNDTPSLDLDASSPDVNFSVTYIENDDPVRISNNASITDVDSTTLQQLVVTIQGGTASDDVLSVASHSSLVSTYVYPTLTVAGEAAIAVYERIIDTITYQNTADEIADISSRMIDFVVTDTSGESGVPVTTTVSIEPVDDNLPVFEPNNTYNFMVDENALNALVGTVVISDADLPSSTYIPVFSIIDAMPTTGLSDFQIVNSAADNFQGEIFVVASLDYEQTPSYVLTVQVSSGNANVTATVNIAVRNRADIAPELQCPAELQVFENEIVSTPLGPMTCTASDPDNLDQVVYSIEGNRIGGVTLVAINSSTGIISVASNIDREMVGLSFVVSVRATDSTQSTARNITIIVLGVNEHNPVIQPVNTTIPENSVPVGGVLLTVVATDLDEAPDLSSSPGFSSRITFNISSVDPPSGATLFSINPTTGEITLLQPIDFETTTMFIITVTATDNDPSMTPRQSSADIFVQVLDINDEAPEFINLPDRIIVSERSIPGEGVAVIAISDPDSNSDLEVTFISPPPANFRLNGSTVLYVSGLLDAEVPPREFFVVWQLEDRNTDPNYNESAVVFRNVTIVVEDANDNSPRFSLREYTGTVLEHSSAGLVLNVSATDDDFGFDADDNSNGNNVLTYSFLGSDAPPADKFGIDSMTGTITTLQPLDREEADQYTFTVLVRDNPVNDTPNVNFARVTIIIADINEFAPVVDPNRYLVYIPESTGLNTEVSTYAPVAWNISGISICCDVC